MFFWVYRAMFWSGLVVCKFLNTSPTALLPFQLKSVKPQLGILLLFTVVRPNSLNGSNPCNLKSFKYVSFALSTVVVCHASTVGSVSCCSIPAVASPVTLIYNLSIVLVSQLTWFLIILKVELAIILLQHIALIIEQTQVLFILTNFPDLTQFHMKILCFSFPKDYWDVFRLKASAFCKSYDHLNILLAVSPFLLHL